MPEQPVLAARINVAEQRLDLLAADGSVQRSFPVSTSRYGTGNRDGSQQTPLGLHRICARFGDGEPIGRVFRARKPTDECVEPVTRVLEQEGGDADYITTRILWLEGLEEGVNRGPGIDSRERYIYIHGTHREDLLGQPASIGCIRIANTAVIELYAALPENAVILIE